MPNEDAMTARQKSIDVIIKGKAARVKALREERQERLGSKQEVSEELKQILAPYNERKAAHLEALKTLKVSKDSLVAAVAEISNKQQQLVSALLSRVARWPLGLGCTMSSVACSKQCLPNLYVLKENLCHQFSIHRSPTSTT